MKKILLGDDVLNGKQPNESFGFITSSLQYFKYYEVIKTCFDINSNSSNHVSWVIQGQTSLSQTCKCLSNWFYTNKYGGPEGSNTNKFRMHKNISKTQIYLGIHRIIWQITN